MQLALNTWGNSLAIRIPKRILELLKLQKGSKVEAVIKSGKLVISPIDAKSELLSRAKRVNFDELVEAVTDENMHNLDEDSIQGNEIW